MRQHQRENRCRKRSIPARGVRARTCARWPCSPVASGQGIVFILLDSLCVIAGYGLAEVAYFRDRAPAHYWQHFLEFLLVAIVVTIVCNRLFGLYGRMWRHAGADEARQLMLSTAVVALRPDRLLARRPSAPYRAGPPHRGGGGMRVLRRRYGNPPLPLAAVRLAARVEAPRPAGGGHRQSRHRGGRHSRDAPQPGGGPGPGGRLRRRPAGPRALPDRRAGGRAGSTTSPTRPTATPSSRCCWPSPHPHRSWSNGLCERRSWPGCR